MKLRRRLKITVIDFDTIFVSQTCTSHVILYRANVHYEIVYFLIKCYKVKKNVCLAYHYIRLVILVTLKKQVFSPNSLKINIICKARNYKNTDYKNMS